jgi:hypothetical protein
VVSVDARRELERAVERVQRELVGGSDRRDDPSARLLVAEVARGLVMGVVDEQQRGVAAGALVDGVGLSSLSTMIGLAPRTLGMRWGKELGTELAPLVWLRDHRDDWISACRDAVRAVRAARDFYATTEARRALSDLSSCEATEWRDLPGTPAIARRLLESTRGAAPDGAEAALDRLGELLESFDHAEPPGRRERAMRRAAR